MNQNNYPESVLLKKPNFICNTLTVHINDTLLAIKDKNNLAGYIESGYEIISATPLIVTNTQYNDTYTDAILYVLRKDLDKYR